MILLTFRTDFVCCSFKLSSRAIPVHKLLFLDPESMDERERERMEESKFLFNCALHALYHVAFHSIRKHFFLTSNLFRLVTVPTNHLRFSFSLLLIASC